MNTKYESLSRKAGDRGVVYKTGQRNMYDWHKAQALAAEGILPPPPDFSADTHKRYRPQLQRVIQLANEGDLVGLQAERIRPISTSPKAIDRYRHLCVAALKVKQVNGAQPIVQPVIQPEENQKKVISRIQTLYAGIDENARRFFDWAASRKNDAAETSIQRISQAIQTTRSGAVQLAKTLSDIGCGEFIVGRKGAESRIRWIFSLASLGRAAKQEVTNLDHVDEELVKDVVEQQGIGVALEPAKDAPLSIAEAKRRLAVAFGVKPEAIEITVRG